MFRKCLLRLINRTVAACWKYPNCRIFAKKDNFKSAYHCCHLHWETALKTMTQILELKMSFMKLWLTFGGKLYPNFWCCMSEIMCNLTTAILYNKEWDLTTLFGRNQHLVPLARRLDDDIHFKEGQKLIVDIEVDTRGTNNIYIDDLVSLAVEIKGLDNLFWCNRAPLLMSNTWSRPLDPNKPFQGKRWKPEIYLSQKTCLKRQKWF